LFSLTLRLPGMCIPGAGLAVIHPPISREGFAVSREEFAVSREEFAIPPGHIAEGSVIPDD